jgi:class 3 adenylate cyclase
MDIVGFTCISATLSSDKVLDMLHRFFARVEAALPVYHLRVIDTMGDAFLGMACGPNHCEDAVLFALFCSRIAAMVPIDLENRNRGPIQVRTAVHTGRVQAIVLDATPYKHTLIGDALNVVKWLETEGVPGGGVHCSMAVKRHLSEGNANGVSGILLTMQPHKWRPLRTPSNNITNDSITTTNSILTTQKTKLLHRRVLSVHALDQHSSTSTPTPTTTTTTTTNTTTTRMRSPKMTRSGRMSPLPSLSFSSSFGSDRETSSTFGNRSGTTLMLMALRPGRGGRRHRSPSSSSSSSPPPSPPPRLPTASSLLTPLIMMDQTFVVTVRTEPTPTTTTLSGSSSSSSSSIPRDATVLCPFTLQFARQSVRFYTLFGYRAGEIRGLRMLCGPKTDYRGLIALIRKAFEFQKPVPALTVSLYTRVGEPLSLSVIVQYCAASTHPHHGPHKSGVRFLSKAWCGRLSGGGDTSGSSAAPGASLA